MKSTVVAALIVESTALYHPSMLQPSYGHTAHAATRKACQPGRPCGSVTPSLTTGRNQAVAWSSHAPKITRCTFLIYRVGCAKTVTCFFVRVCCGSDGVHILAGPRRSRLLM